MRPEPDLALGSNPCTSFTFWYSSRGRLQCYSFVTGTHVTSVCYAMRCCGMLFYVTLCYNMLCHIMLCYFLCVYVCTYVRMYVCTYVRMYVCMYVSMYLSMYVRLHVCMCIYMYIYIYTLYTCMHICTYTYTHIQIYNTYLPACLHACMHTCLYRHTHTDAQTQFVLFIPKPYSTCDSVTAFCGKAERLEREWQQQQREVTMMRGSRSC